MSVKMIVAEAAEAFDLAYLEITGRGRARQMVKARTAAAMALRRRGFSYPRIGQLLGGRDHSSVIYYCDSCRHFLDDPAFAELVDRLAQIKTNCAISRPNGRPRKPPPQVLMVKGVRGLDELPQLHAYFRPPPPKPDSIERLDLDYRKMMTRGSTMLAKAISERFWVQAA